jgi:hypothetical protein
MPFVSSALLSKERFSTALEVTELKLILPDELANKKSFN